MYAWLMHSFVAKFVHGTNFDYLSLSSYRKVDVASEFRNYC